MSNYLDEIAIVAENREPIPFEEAVVHGTAGKRFVFVSPTMELCECKFRRYLNLFPPALLRKIHSRRIILLDDSELIFLTDYLIEHGALRGIGKVVWCI